MAPPSKGAAATTAAVRHALSPARLDAFLVHLNLVMQTPSGSDAVLATVCYSARLASVLLTAAAGRQLPAGSALGLSKRMRALGSLMTELRMMTRLWGMLSMYVWGRQLLQQLLARRKASQNKHRGVGKGEAGTTTTTTAADTLVAWSQFVSCSAYQVLENCAYLAQRGVLPLSPAAQTRAYLWSSRAFCVYVALELGRLAAALSASSGSGSTPEKRAGVFELQRSAVRYMAFAPASVSWSMEKGFLNESGSVALGLVPAVLQIHKMWNETKGES